MYYKVLTKKTTEIVRQYIVIRLVTCCIVLLQFLIVKFSEQQYTTVPIIRASLGESLRLYINLIYGLMHLYIFQWRKYDNILQYNVVPPSVIVDLST